jgi:hypothetical protein
MEPGEALGIAAQIAVALAGFAGVVVVFRREAVHEWSGRRQTAVTSVACQFHIAAGSFDAGIAVAHHQTCTTRKLEMVQRYSADRDPVVRNPNYKSFSGA